MQLQLAPASDRCASGWCRARVHTAAVWPDGDAAQAVLEANMLQHTQLKLALESDCRGQRGAGRVSALPGSLMVIQPKLRVKPTAHAAGPGK